MAQATTTTTHRDHDRGRTPAQWYCTVVGLVLLLVGVLGFIADATFDTGSSGDPNGGNVGGGLQGDSFLGFEVNGWHNVVHILSGLVLLAMAKKRATAKTAALVFGVVYGLVAIIGLIDGDDVLGLIPVNPADNVLHLALSALGILTALRSDADDRDLHRGTGAGTGTVTDSRTVGTGRFGRTETEVLTPEDHNRTTRP